MNDREQRLPGWAVGELARLRRDLASAQDALQGFSEGTGPVRVDVYSRAPLHFSERTVLQFQMSERRTDYITVSLQDGALSINGGTGRIIVLPEAANMLRIRSGQ